jgi:hypothetical protein
MQTPFWGRIELHPSIGIYVLEAQKRYCCLPNLSTAVELLYDGL